MSPACFPPTVSDPVPSFPLAGSPRSGSPAVWYYEDTPTSAARLARSLRSLRDTNAASGPFAPPLSDALAEGQGCLKRDPRPLAWWQLETADLPGSCEDPVDGSLGSWAPVGAERQAVTACRRGPRLCQERGLPTRKVSRLDVQAFHLAVYASQGGSPRRHARLASGCWPALPGGIGYPQGPYGWFPRCNRYISSSLPQALPGAMTPFSTRREVSQGGGNLSIRDGVSRFSTSRRSSSNSCCSSQGHRERSAATASPRTCRAWSGRPRPASASAR
jgi:hypothetical protein